VEGVHGVYGVLRALVDVEWRVWMESRELRTESNLSNQS
jgi:hypothetical protein